MARSSRFRSIVDSTPPAGANAKIKSEENKMIVYQIQDREAGNPIEDCTTYEEAIQKLAAYEASDREDGIYTPNYYAIVEVEIDG
jgi:hypothetical protein